jgi:hypothetical protein
MPIDAEPAISGHPFARPESADTAPDPDPEPRQDRDWAFPDPRIDGAMDVILPRRHET